MKKIFKRLIDLFLIFITIIICISCNASSSTTISNTKVITTIPTTATQDVSPWKSG